MFLQVDLSFQTFWLDRGRALVGIVAMVGTLYLLSENRRAISRRTLVVGLALQVGLGLVLLWVPAGRWLMGEAARVVDTVLQCTLAGSSFVFGPKLVDPTGPTAFVFAFRVLPTVIFVAALFAVLYYLRIMPAIVGAFAWVMARLLRSSGAESLNTAASLFLGQTEAPLTIRPFLPGLTRSELLVVMVSGMGLVAGGVLGAYIETGARAQYLLTAILMSAPATIFLSKVLIPETREPETLGRVRIHIESPDANLIDAAARGTREGLTLALNIGAMLISFIALIELTNRGLLLLGGAVGLPALTLQHIFAFALAPLAWFMGVPWADAPHVGSLLGQRLVLNEVIAYGDLGKLAALFDADAQRLAYSFSGLAGQVGIPAYRLVPRIEPRSYAMATIALCGFANISSIGIQIGGIGPLLPEPRRHELAVLGLRALLVATLANFLSASIAGLFLT